MPADLIVIIDDDEDLVKLLTHVFTNEGYHSVAFYNGKEAIEFLVDKKNKGKISLIVLDRLLPDMDGIEILRKFKEKNNLSVPVLILSILSGDDDVLKGLKMGAIDYISKPFNLSLLIEKSLKLLESEK